MVGVDKNTSEGENGGAGAEKMEDGALEKSVRKVEKRRGAYDVSEAMVVSTEDRGALASDLPIVYVKPDRLLQPGEQEQFVTNRRGEREAWSLDRILDRLRLLAVGLSPEVDCARVAQKVVNGMYNGVKTSLLDEMAAETCAYMSTSHWDYSKLAARLAIDNLHKESEPRFSKVVEELFAYVDEGRDAPILGAEFAAFVGENADALDAMLDHGQDKHYDFFAWKTLERAYLLRTRGRIAERPQCMLMRVAVGVHYKNTNTEETDPEKLRTFRLAKIEQTYKLLSQRYFTHATPTLFNAGTRNPQMSSCFLLTMQADSIDGIYGTLAQCARISKTAGGVGVNVSDIRGNGTYIRGTNGRSNGLVPMLRVFNASSRYVDQGGGKRKGTIAVYLEPWHVDILAFLDLKKNTGQDELRARDLFYGLWIPDLFMERVHADGEWSLMCPNHCPGLTTTYGEEFEALYTKYEREGRRRGTIKAQKLWFKILDSQIETGTPYFLYKDACNRKSNQQHLGVIKGSNLCTEVVQFTSPEEVAVCNLCSIGLPRYLRAKSRGGGAAPRTGAELGPGVEPKGAEEDDPAAILPLQAEAGQLRARAPRRLTHREIEFDFALLGAHVGLFVENLNNVIDNNFYPVPEARVSNMKHRPIGIGVQGLADLFMRLRYPFESEEAAELNISIFECIYYHAVQASVRLAKLKGPFESFPGCPASKGLLQYDLWGKTAWVEEERNRYDWKALKADVMKYGMRNSLLVAPMPTASTSQILGNNEAFEPYTSNIYYRRVMSGEFFVVNPHLLQDLIDLGLWNDQAKQQLMYHNGSVAALDIPADLKAVYKTVWEIKQRAVLRQSIERGPFIDQSQSLNIHIAEPTYSKLTSMHFYGWKGGLKTGCYYLRIRPAADAIKFTVTGNHEVKKEPAAAPICDARNKEDCLACGS